jgi:acetyltransferase-like isoleucine patch superfamily enzyme
MPLRFLWSKVIIRKVQEKLYTLLIRIASRLVPSNLPKKSSHDERINEHIGLINNGIFIIAKNGEKRRLTSSLTGLRIVGPGKNNVVEIHEGAVFSNALIDLRGNHAVIKLASGVYNNARILIAFGDYQSLEIGEGFACHGVVFSLKEDYASIQVGKDCLFSYGIEIWATDGHAILQNGQATNESKPIIIGNHIWIGANVRICKGSSIANDSVIGMSSLVAGKFTEPNVVIAGNPAKIIKTNINWDKKSAYNYNRQKKHVLSGGGGVKKNPNTRSPCGVIPGGHRK